jgi:hypothetical protein
MSVRHLFVAAATTLTSASVLTAQPVPQAALTAVTDCRAGCQGGEGNCQESTQKAVFTASDGYHLIPGSQVVIRHWNASDSPGLRAEPKWLSDPLFYQGKLLRVTIRPDITTCVGVSPHTQGVTFYEIQMLQQR